MRINHGSSRYFEGAQCTVWKSKQKSSRAEERKVITIGKREGRQRRSKGESERAQTKTHVGADANAGGEDERKEADSREDFEEDVHRLDWIRLETEWGGRGEGETKTKPKRNPEQRRAVGLY